MKRNLYWIHIHRLERHAASEITFVRRNDP